MNWSSLDFVSPDFTWLEVSTGSATKANLVLLPSFFSSVVWMLARWIWSPLREFLLFCWLLGFQSGRKRPPVDYESAELELERKPQLAQFRFCFFLPRLVTTSFSFCFICFVVVVLVSGLGNFFVWRRSQRWNPSDPFNKMITANNVMAPMGWNFEWKRIEKWPITRQLTTTAK